MRLPLPMNANDRAAFLDQIAEYVYPSFDFYLLSILAAVIIGAGFLLSAPALLVLGAVLAPMMMPMVGISLGTVIGSGRFFARSLLGLLIAGLLVLLVGTLMGYLVRPALPAELGLVYVYTQLNWTNFLVLAAGAILTSAAVARNLNGPMLTSVALAYELFLPLVAAGFGLGSGVPHMWPDGLVVFVVYLAWGALLGAITLAVLGFRPMTLFGYTLGAALTLIGIILLIGLSVAGAAFGAQVALPTPIPSSTSTITPTVTVTLTPVPPTATLTPTVTPSPTLTPTFTPTLTPTPLIALVRSRDAVGAILRETPGGRVIGSYLDNTLMQVLPEIVESPEGVWVHVVGPDGKAGWMLQDLLLTATPAPNW